MVFINSLDLARVRDNTKYFYGHVRKFPSMRIFAQVIADGLVVLKSSFKGLALFDEPKELLYWGGRDEGRVLLQIVDYSFGLLVYEFAHDGEGSLATFEFG
jgi:hypothetical protein